MSVKRTFVDANLLIWAARGKHPLSDRALAVLDDPERTFTTSDFVKLEVLPKAIHGKRSEEVAFYEEFFRAATEVVESSAELVGDAFTEAQKHGLSAVDALHVAAAKRAGSEEFFTAEKSTKPLFRVHDLRVVTIVD